MSSTLRGAVRSSSPLPDVVPTPASLAAVSVPGGPVVIPDGSDSSGSSKTSGTSGYVRVVFRWSPAPGTRIRPRRVWLDVTGITHRSAVDAAWMRPTDDGRGWHLTLRLPASLRASYSFVPVPHDDPLDLDDVMAARAFLAGGLADPHVAETLPDNGWRGVRSVLTLPAARPGDWVAPRAETARSFTLDTLDDPARTVRWHETPGPSDVERPLVFVFDAEVWLGPLNVAASLDRLVRRGALPPLVVAGLENPYDSRELDLTTPDRISTALRRDVLPALRERVAFAADPDRRLVAGQSYGGLATFRVLCEVPDLFGLGVCQSPSFWFPGSTDLVDRLPTGTRLVLEHGTREGDLTDAAREVRRRLAPRIPALTHREVEGGHDHAWWRDGLVAGIRALLAGS